MVGDTLCDSQDQQPLASPPLDAPTIAVTISPNTSPVNGKVCARVVSMCVCESVCGDGDWIMIGALTVLRYFCTRVLSLFYVAFLSVSLYFCLSLSLSFSPLYLSLYAFFIILSCFIMCCFSVPWNQSPISHLVHPLFILFLLYLSALYLSRPPRTVANTSPPPSFVSV